MFASVKKIKIEENPMGVIAHGATLFNENVNELKKEKYKKLKG